MLATEVAAALAQVALICALAILGHAALQRLVPRLFRVALQRRAGAEAAEALERREATLTGVVLRTAEALLLFIVALMILAVFGINIAPALASVGIIGLALGLGAQVLVRDVISGLFILVEDQYRVGDIVRVANVTGTVLDLNLRRTVLRDLEGVMHSVPNGEIRVASNLTRELGRLNIDVPLAYGVDLERVRETVNAVGSALAADPFYGPMLAEPPRMLRVEGFQDTGILVRITGATRPGRQWEVAGEVRRRLLAALAEAELPLPYAPRLDVASPANPTPPGTPSASAQRQDSGRAPTS